MKRASVAACVLLAANTASAVPIDAVRVVATYPHDPSAFTEGLFYDDGHLMESTGLEGQSSLREVDLRTGKVLHQTSLPSALFGEGIARIGERVVQLTWRNQVAFFYGAAKLNVMAQTAYRDEGWGMTNGPGGLVASDGTSTLMFLDPKTLLPTRQLHVTADGCPISNLNELEWVDGQIYANIWQTDLIARIDPQTGNVVRFLTLAGVAPPHEPGTDAVANGIAYDEKAKRLFVTGKLWPQLYQIEIAGSSGQHIACHGRARLEQDAR